LHRAKKQIKTNKKLNVGLLSIVLQPL